MSMHRWRRWLTPLLLIVVLLVGGCASAPPSRFDQAQQESTQPKATPAVAKDATQGSSFNKFFPESANGLNRVYTQEKKGFAEAKLNQGTTTVATLSISDTISTPDAAAKFKQSTKTIAGYPAVAQGDTATALLVGDRYQVKVASRAPSFTEKDREAWLQKFDLKGLSQLK